MMSFGVPLGAKSPHQPEAPRHCCAESGRRGLLARNLRLLTHHQHPPAIVGGNGKSTS
jgi:hypothetical protein